MDYKALGRKIKKLREAQGFSLESLWGASKVAKNTINQIELGRGNPTIETLEALAAALGEPIISFFDLESGGKASGEALATKGFESGYKQIRKHALAEKEKQMSGAKTGRKLNRFPTPSDLSFAAAFLDKVQSLTPYRKAFLFAVAYKDENYLDGQPFLAQAYRILSQAPEK